MIPSPREVGWRARQAGVEDSHGNPIVSWADPVPLPVHAVVDAWAALPDALRDGSSLSLVVYAPAGFPALVGDLLRVEGRDHDVVKVVDYTKGPWPNPVAGVEVHLSRTEG